MSATDDDTELRDLLIQNLENNGVLNKLKVRTLSLILSIITLTESPPAGKLG